MAATKTKPDTKTKRLNVVTYLLNIVEITLQKSKDSGEQEEALKIKQMLERRRGKLS